MPAMNALAELIALLAPPGCLACGRALARADDRLCAGCVRSLAWLRSGCPRCALPKHRGRRCPAAGAAFGRAWAPVAYEGVARRLVAALKFRGALAAADLMAAHMAANLPLDLRAVVRADAAGASVPRESRAAGASQGRDSGAAGASETRDARAAGASRGATLAPRGRARRARLEPRGRAEGREARRRGGERDARCSSRGGERAARVSRCGGGARAGSGGTGAATGARVRSGAGADGRARPADPAAARRLPRARRPHGAAGRCGAPRAPRARPPAGPRPRRTAGGGDPRRRRPHDGRDPRRLGAGPGIGGNDRDRGDHVREDAVSRASSTGRWVSRGSASPRVGLRGSAARNCPVREGAVMWRRPFLARREPVRSPALPPASADEVSTAGRKVRSHARRSSGPGANDRRLQGVLHKGSTCRNKREAPPSTRQFEPCESDRDPA